MTSEDKINKHEEARALFVLGFLAVLASVRSQSINAVVGQNTYPLNPLIDTTLLLMSLYAIFMVFAYSKDMIGESFAQTFKTLALGVLSLSFMVLIVFGVFYGVVLYQNRLIYMVGVIAVPIAYLSYVKINEIRKKANKEKSVTMKLPTKKTIVGLLSSTGLVLSIVMIISYSPEQYLWIFFITASVSMVALLFLANKAEKSKQKPQTN